MSHSLLFNTYGLALFVVLTIVRQGTHLVHLRYRTSARTTRRYAGEFVSTSMMYILYFVIWVGSILSFLRNGTTVSYYFAGMAALLVGIWLRYLGVKELGGNFASSILIRSEHQLVRSGVYSMFRHPIHLALLVELAGMAVIAPSAVTGTALALMSYLVVWRNRREDEILIAFFGSSARDYCQRVPAMNPLPLLRAGFVEVTAKSRSEQAR